MSDNHQEEKNLTLEERLSKLEAMEALKRLKIRYAQLGDRHNFDPDQFVELFAENGVWEGPGFGSFSGREAIKTFQEKWPDVIKWSHHVLANPVIEIEAQCESATGEWDFIILATMTSGNEAAPLDAVVISGRYEDEFVKVDGEWKFKHLISHTHHISNFEEGWVKQPFRET